MCFIATLHSSLRTYSIAQPTYESLMATVLLFWVTESFHQFIHPAFCVFHPQNLCIMRDWTSVCFMLREWRETEELEISNVCTNLKWNDTFVGFLSFCLMHFREAYGGIMLKHLSTLWTQHNFLLCSQPFFVPFCLFIGVWVYFDIKRSKPFYFIVTIIFKL